MHGIDENFASSIPGFQDAVRKEKALKPRDHEHQKAALEVDEINRPGVSTLGGTIRIPLL